ncbi:MAG TPA: hypothetical protein VG938_11240 [Verrucomicrobiae bacterium]|jgi:hypothetical protein|nr:hypothetical protein [Verrucomicrobiae bacterium]
MKNHLISKMAALSAILITSTAVFGDPVIIITDGVTSTGPITLPGGAGSYINGSFDNTWDFVITSGESKPALGSADSPNMELSITADSLGSGSDLTIIFSDNNFGPTTGNLTANFIGHPFNNGTGDAISFDTYYDVNNALAALTTPITSADGMTPDASNTYQSVKTGSIALPAGYSLTEVVTIKGGHASSYSLSANLQGTNQPPPPCICTLNFTSPASITNCAGDVISDITATQNCGSGTTPAIVTPVSATTNGTCPQIITRTVSATDGCGVAHPFTQTITINCSPDCTITPSATTTTVGTSNLTASVANAGAGATYVWNILNGTITSGQGTTKITWTAGTDTTVPVTISVALTSPAGCQSMCSASVRLVTGPACTINGVTISNTSWNKFNIPSGTSPVVWVHAHLNGISGIPKIGVTTVQFVGVSITLDGTSYPMPDGVITFNPSAPATPTTTYTGGKWQTTINPNNLSDEMFFTGAAIPVTSAIANGAKATLTFTSLSSVAGISYSWQWSAAVFTFWPSDWNQAMIQPYHKGDHAGTPENTTVQKSLIQGPRGGGGSNFTGSWSATGSAACQ